MIKAFQLNRRLSPALIATKIGLIIIEFYEANKRVFVSGANRKQTTLYINHRTRDIGSARTIYEVFTTVNSFFT